MLGLSTAWFSGECSHGDELLSRISETGLTHLEIDYRVTADVLRQIKPAIRRGEFQVLSLHNYCPLPEGEVKDNASSLYQPSSLDAEERKLAIRYSIRTLQQAAELEARVVVFHLGKVEMAHNGWELFDLYHQGRIHSAEAEAWRETKLAERRAKANPYLECLLQTLDPIHEEACRLGVCIGAENRYRFNQIPVAEEFERLFLEFRGGVLRYWHDTGHGELQQRLGFLDHEKDLLARHQSHLAGFHLHDVAQLQDHLPPGQGDLDFNRIKPYVTEKTVNILEVHPPATANDIRASVAYLRNFGFAE